MEKAPFQVGDFVMKKTLFGREKGIVNRIWPTCHGWEMLVDDYKWPPGDRMLRWCRTVSTRGWYKI